MKLSRKLNALVSAALLLDGGLAAATPRAGKFNILSMNVAGLPAWLNKNGVPGDKGDNAELMGSKFAQYGYDVIQLQEDFNYHAYIYRTDTHPFRTATSGGVPIGSGLNTLSNYRWVDFERIKWKKCSDITAADCLTPKGFSFMRIDISGGSDDATGVYIDFYNVHTDAGTSAIDYWARQDNVKQLADYIAANSAGNAVIMYGDFNSLYSRKDTAVRELLAGETAAGAGFRDVWVELKQGGVIPGDKPECGTPAAGDCETLDKVFYRSGTGVALQATEFRYDTANFLQADGNILSDHNPVYVNFSWTAK